jgi:hypothetical protein
MDRKGICNQETAKLIQAETPCVGMVEGRRAIIEANSWEEGVVTKGRENYVTASFLREDVKDGRGDGLPLADTETQSILNQLTWTTP